MTGYSVNPESPIPLYYQVYTSLRKRIQSSEFSANDALPPERQLVRDYGVSRITIVKALDMLENEKLIRREHGRGTFINTADNENKPATITFVSGVMLHPYIYNVLMGIARAAAENQYKLQVVALQDESVAPDSLDTLAIDDAAGVLIYARPNDFDLGLCQEIHDRGIPLVMIDRFYPQISCDYVIFDEETAAYQLTHYLIGRGHKRIALLTHYEVDVSSIHNRITGYRRALEEYQLYDEALIWLDVYAELHVSKGSIGNERMTAHLHEYLEEYKPTAALAINHDVAERLAYDLMLINAERARQAIHNSGSAHYEISLDISAFTHRDLSSYSPHNIISGLQPGDVLGQQAAELLITRLSNTGKPAPQQVRVPVKIIIPDHTGSAALSVEADQHNE